MWACLGCLAKIPRVPHSVPPSKHQKPFLLESPSPRCALTQLLQPFLLLLSPLPDAFRLLSQPVSLGNCSIAIGRPVSLLQPKHSVPGPSCLPCCWTVLTGTKIALKPGHTGSRRQPQPTAAPAPGDYTLCPLCQQRCSRVASGRSTSQGLTITRPTPSHTHNSPHSISPLFCPPTHKHDLSHFSRVRTLLPPKLFLILPDPLVPLPCKTSLGQPHTTRPLPSALKHE